MTVERPPSDDQFDICEKHSSFNAGGGPAICTSRLKTEPFNKWLRHFFPGKNCVIYYGFDENERVRIQRRSSVLGQMGYRSVYPLAHWDRTIRSSLEVGVLPPNTYDCFKHANCIGCLKAGRQHWYVVFVKYPDVFQRAKAAEEEIGHSIINGVYLEELEGLFLDMKSAGIPANEHIPPQRFWAVAKKTIRESEQASQCDVSDSEKPCECVF